MCYDGANCKRPFCFFAHSPGELRRARGSSSETRVRLKSVVIKSQQAQQQEQEQQGLSSKAAAAQPPPQAAPGTADGSDSSSSSSTSNCWQAYALPESLGSSESLPDEALGPSSNLPHSADGSSSSSGGGESSSRHIVSSAGSTGDGASAAAAAVTAADATLLQQLQLQLQFESCSRTEQQSVEAESETDADAVWNSVQALISCLSLEASLGQVTDATIVGAEAFHEAPVAAAAAVLPGHGVEQGPTPDALLCVTDSFTATHDKQFTSGLEQQQQQQRVTSGAQVEKCVSQQGSAAEQERAGRLWGAAAAAGTMQTVAAAAGTLQKVAAAASMQVCNLQDAPPVNIISSSCCELLLASSACGSQQSLTSLTGLTRSTAVDPADSVLDDVAPLGLFGAVQPRTAHK
jgi:hypothetical protein